MKTGTPSQMDFDKSAPLRDLPEKGKRNPLEEPRRTGEVSLTSILVCVGILAFAIVNQYLGR